MIFGVCLLDIVARSGPTSFFKVENKRLLELNEAGSADNLESSSNNVRYVDLLEYRNWTTENGSEKTNLGLNQTEQVP